VSDLAHLASDAHSARRVVVLRPGALGDAVLTLPALAGLRAAGCAPTVVGNPASWAFLDEPVLDIDSPDWLPLFGAERPFGPRAAQALDGAAVVAWLPHAAPIPALAIDPPHRDEDQPPHAAERLWRPVARWLGRPGAPLPDVRFDILPERLAKRLVVLHPGSGGRRKCWPAESFAALAERLEADGFTIAVTLGPADLDLAPAFAGLRVIRDQPLRRIAALLAGAAAYLGNDSGMSHLAARLCPTVALFGPTNPEVWAPLGPCVRVLPMPADVEQARAALRDCLS
jgi:ADP-heptose:LPS heptosyltransferase